MKFKAQIFVINRKDWSFDGKSGTTYSAQMLVTSAREEDGKMVEDVFVARLKVPEHMKNTQPGEYITELVPFADGNGNLDFRVVALVPLNRPAANAKTPATAAA